jgi:hypothetical protein
MKVSETDKNITLLMAGGESFAQVSDSGSGIDDGNASSIRKRDLKTSRIPESMNSILIAYDGMKNTKP